MKVLSWIVLIISALLVILHLLNLLMNDNGKRRLASAIDIIFFGITFITDFFYLFGGK